METRQYDREKVKRPMRYLLLAIIQQALLDAGPGNEYVSPQARRTACSFLRSQIYRDLCDYLGVPPRVARLAAEKAMGNRTRVRKRRKRRVKIGAEIGSI